MNTLRLRNLQPGQRFILLRTGDRYEFIGHKRDTPGGTAVRRAAPGVHQARHPAPACHVRAINTQSEK